MILINFFSWVILRMYNHWNQPLPNNQATSPSLYRPSYPQSSREKYAATPNGIAKAVMNQSNQGPMFNLQNQFNNAPPLPTYATLSMLAPVSGSLMTKRGGYSGENPMKPGSKTATTCAYLASSVATTCTPEALAKDEAYYR